MLRSIYVLLLYFAILGVGLGFGIPYILTLGYIWTDIFRPNNVVYAGFRFIPVALIMGAAAAGGYLLFDRKSPPRIGAHLVLITVFSIWITLTTLWAVSPDDAWKKWQFAFNTVAFSAFIPFVIRSKNQIEGFLQIVIFSLLAHLIPFGLKTLVTGGGYGRFYGLIDANFYLGQGETLAIACILVIPFILFLMKHSVIIPKSKLTQFGYIGIIAFSIITAVGTHERTALVAMVVCAATIWWTARRKILWAVLIAVAGVIVVAEAPDSWKERMATISASPTDDSAVTRIKVWAWTLAFVGDHPQGGGFDAYRTNIIVIPNPENGGPPKVERSRAYHSSYFEVLGEHGWIGLCLFMALVTLSFRYLGLVLGATKKNPRMQWSGDLAYALQSSLLIMLASGTVTAMAFQPFFYYLFAISFCLREYVRRMESPASEARLAVPVPALAPASALSASTNARP